MSTPNFFPRLLRGGGLKYLYLPFNHRVIILNQKYPGIRGLRVILVGENNVVELVAFGPLDVAAGGVGFGFGVRVVIRIHLAVVLFDIQVDAQQVLRVNLGEIIFVFGSVGGRVVLDHLSILASQQTAGLVGIARNNVRDHLLVHCRRDTHDKTSAGHHNSFASKSSSSSANSRVHRSSLRYFQPPSARITTILPCSMLAATRSAACSTAPHDGPAKMSSWSFNWRVRRMASTPATRIFASSSD